MLNITHLHDTFGVNAIYKMLLAVIDIVEELTCTGLDTRTHCDVELSFV